MKRILSLLAVLLLLALCILPAAAADQPASDQDGAAITAAETPTEGEQDGVVQEDDMRIDLHLTTTLIIVICSVLTVGIITVVVILARRNRG